MPKNFMKQNDNCQHVQKKFSDYIEKMLNNNQVDTFEKHIRNCGKCGAEFQKYQNMIFSLNSFKEIDLPENFNAELHKKLVEASVNLSLPANGKFHFKNILFNRFVYVPILSALFLATVLSTGVLDNLQYMSTDNINKIQTNQIGKTEQTAQDEKYITQQSEESADNIENDNSAPVKQNIHLTPEVALELPSASSVKEHRDENFKNNNIENEKKSEIVLQDTAILPENTDENNVIDVISGGMETAQKSYKSIEDIYSSEAETQYSEEGINTDSGNIEPQIRKFKAADSSELHPTEIPKPNAAPMTGGSGGHTTVSREDIAPYSSDLSVPENEDKPESIQNESKPGSIQIKKIYVYKIITSDSTKVLSLISDMRKAVYREEGKIVAILTQNEYNTLASKLDSAKSTVSYIGEKEMEKSYEKAGYCRVEIITSQ